MNSISIALLVLLPTGPAGSSARVVAPTILAFETVEELKAEIEAAKNAHTFNKTKALDFSERALRLAKSAKDAATRASAADVCLGMRLSIKVAELELLRAQMWDLVLNEDVDNGAALAPLVLKYMRDVDRATELAAKTKAPEIKAACAMVALAPLANLADRSEADAKKYVDAVHALKQEFGKVVEPESRKLWSEICDDKLFSLERLSIGSDVPDIEGTDTTGVKFKLSDYRGKVVLLDFWGYW